MKKNVLLTTILLLSISSSSFAQMPGWLWAKNSGGIASDNGSGVACDPNGNVYVSGYFTSDTIRCSYK